MIERVSGLGNLKKLENLQLKRNRIGSDGIDDVVCRSPFFSFLVSSGKDGRLIGHSSDLGTLRNNIIEDINGD